MIPLDAFLLEARAFLDANAERKPEADDELRWGEGEFSVALFQNLGHDEEKAFIDRYRAWITRKADAGFHAISWEPEFGGRGLPLSYERAFGELEAQYVTAPGHESVGITLGLCGPTVRAFGTDEQRRRHLPPLLRADEMWCQLMSEPGAGSDLAGLSTRAVRDGDEWVVNGQKVWTSGAQYADFGYLLARTDPDVPKHKGITAFIVDMRAPGVMVRPLRQMTGGASFNEVFFDDVRVHDSMRLGEVGEGWRVAVTTLGFERNSMGDAEPGPVSGATVKLLALARHMGMADDPVARQALAEVWIEQRLIRITADRVAGTLKAGQVPGPEGSIGKLAAARGEKRLTNVAAGLLGMRITADTGEWGTYAWSERLLGAVGSRVAGGTDEIQRNIIGERVLGLPPEPRLDRDAPWSALAR